MHTFRHKRREARCQSSLSTWRVSCCSPLRTQASTHLSVPKDPCVSKYKSTGYRDVSMHPALHQSGGSEFRSSQLHDNCFTRELLLQALGEHILSLSICVGPRNSFAGLFCFDFYCSPLSSEHKRKGHLVTK